MTTFTDCDGFVYELRSFPNGLGQIIITEPGGSKLEGHAKPLHLAASEFELLRLENEVTK